MEKVSLGLLYKLYYPKSKFSDGYRDYAFLNFSYEKAANNAVKILDGQKMGYVIISVTM